MEIGDRRITILDLVRVATTDTQVSVSQHAIAQVERARERVLRLAANGPPIYGLNSALGANTGAKLAPADLEAYQRRAVRARAVAVGKPYDTISVRAMQFARIAGLVQAGSGVSPQVLQACVDLLNRRVHPVVPRWGSIGVSDMPLLAHLALPLLGEGQAEYLGETFSGADALARAGLKPLTLGAKDGLALFSANAATAARGGLVVYDLLQTLDAWLATIALSYEGYRANASPLRQDTVAARPAAGQVAVAARLRQLLAGGQLLTPGNARRVQDPVSFRVVAQVHGAAQAAAEAARKEVEVELNSAADSPLVMADEDLMLSTGNFHLPATALALDSCAIALAQMASMGVSRCQRFMSPNLTDLPLQLTRHGPAHSGFATIQKTLVVLWSEIRQRANPGSLDYMPVSETIEDHACMSLSVAEKLAEGLERARYLIAIELIIAAQAVDLRGTDRALLGDGARQAYDKVRALVPRLDEDRSMGTDIELICNAVADGAFSQLQIGNVVT
jgi:histidine ammonia-lyase